jgi:hypothetical protein
MKIALVSISFALIASPPAGAQQPALQIDWYQSPVNGLWYGVDVSETGWSAAQALAVTLGGHLATVRSAAEQAWIENTFADYLPDHGLWIGFNDLETEGLFGWSSGEPWTGYENWAPGEPNNLGNEDCAHIKGPASPQTQWFWNDAIVNADRIRPLIESEQVWNGGWSWPESASVAPIPRAGALADVDADGDNDFVAICSGAPYPETSPGLAQILLNDGSGVLASGATVAIPAAPRGICALDFDGDGDDDLVVASMFGGELVLLEMEDGLIQSTATLDAGANFFAVEAVDLDADGWGDLVATTVVPLEGPALASDSVRVYLGQPSGTFSLASSIGGVGSFPSDVAHGDLDGDGDEDLLVTMDESHTFVVLENDGAGSLSPVAPPAGGAYATGLYPRSVVSGDLDLDGDLDAAIAAHGSDRVEVWLNDGFGAFAKGASFDAGSIPLSLAQSDLNGDGAVDLFVASAGSNEARVFWNDGMANFAGWESFDGHPEASYALTGRLDADAEDDLLLLRTGADSIVYWVNGHGFDCDDNGVSDAAEIAADPTLDCNANGQLDSCDLANGTSVDQDSNGIPDDCVPAPLASDLTDVSVSTGGQQQLTLTADPSLSLKVFFVLGSASGTAPGVTIDGVHLPLQVFDPYFLYTVSEPNAPPFINTLGFLSPSGTASATIDVPIGQPSWAGVSLNHAYLVFGGDQSVLFASNPVPLVLVP